VGKPKEMVVQLLDPGMAEERSELGGRCCQGSRKITKWLMDGLRGVQNGE
jgi:hypothetical protein